MKYFFTALFLCFSITVFAQQGFLFEQKNDVKIVIGSDTLMHAWVGGFNSPVFSKIDLNQDGTEDLYVFDRETKRSTTFLADHASGTWKWKPAPQYESLFPDKLAHWVLLRDYNGDGKKDLFTIQDNNALVVCKNVSAAGGSVLFDQPKFLKEGNAQTFTIISESKDVLPSITDLDNDGDLDLLFFSGQNGRELQYYRNTSIESYGRADSLWFSKAAQSWGGLYRCASPGICNAFAFQNFTTCKVSGTNHNGYANVLALDLDNDLDKDLLLGEDGCNTLVRLTNFGTPAAAQMNPYSLQTSYPPNTTPVLLENYPAAYYEDVDFDGVKDLLVAPFVKDNRSDKVPMSNTVWFYKNMAATAAPVFSFVKKNFLQDDMIELGEAARPVFADIDADGDQDLLIGNYADAYRNQYISTVSLLENIGTATKPLFKLTNPDYLQLSADSLKDLKLQFADMNADGSLDLVIKYIDGNVASLKYIPNTALPNQPFQFLKTTKLLIGIGVDKEDAPFFADLDGDGDLDMLLGTRSVSQTAPSSGALWYYKRIGANAGSYQSWQLDNADLGVIPRDFEHYELQPTILDMNQDGKSDLATVSNSGRVEVYSDVMSNLSGTFSAYTHTLFNPLKNVYEPSRFGLTLHAAYADLDGDQKPEVVVGTRAGGVVFLKNNSTVQLGVKENLATDLKLNVYPNPATETVNVSAAEKVQVSVFDAAGREVLVKINGFGKQHQLNVSGLKPGVYFLKIATEDFRSTGRTFVVGR
ncbi:T9SS type A sorting domain-containing protein [Adhaeribacter sp. BT258]|uniref:T9SS type A sorting domain-containing protein n=1 Tax=Adhaeribacter terrigena TaxID=2793070 RepID=A0ABS1C1X2_9BACT|nr:T9SS type A sorting domain-containing protein [Adhaeribacter terrigena]MBK0403399.1 T9SS type A sorting domain-containing protein [Adhaeribacter terrigena]